MNFILSILKGIMLGAGAILPGISSGVLLVIFGIYEKLVDSILNFFKDMKNNFKFLFPIFLGIAIGIILFGNILKYFFTTFPYQTNFAFIGLILGCIPSLLKSVNEKSKFHLHYLLYTFATFTLTIVLLILEKHFVTNNLYSNSSSIYLTFSGFIMSIGVVIPGVSSSVLLMILGTYNLYLEAVSSINLIILIPMGIGLIIGSLIFLKIIKYCLDNYFARNLLFHFRFCIRLCNNIISWASIKFNRINLYNLFPIMLQNSYHYWVMSH